MRDLDQKQLITGDFICVYGDVVANIPMETALLAHRTRREKSKKAIMTMILREAGDFHRTKSHNIRQTFVIDPEAEQCVHYEEVRPRQDAYLDIPMEVFNEHAEIDARQDLIDCGVDICTPEVLAQYTDNFDWQSHRRGFLHGILKDYETNQLTIHTHITNHNYAARVKNLQVYDAVSRDVVSRWSYPICPDFNMRADQSYRLGMRNLYKEDGVVLARSSVIGRNTVLGRATSVGEKSKISNSIIGRRCVIGKRVKIDGAYLWDDVQIGDDTVIDKSIIANNAGVGNRCHVQAGALISFGVWIADGTTVKGDSRIVKHKPEGIEADTTNDVKPVSEGSEGYEMEADEDEDELAETLLTGDIYNRSELSMSAASISTLNSDDEEDEEAGDGVSHRRSSRSDSFASVGSDESGDTRELRRKAADFHHEASAGIFDALQKEEDANTIALELQALRLSSNAEDKQVRKAVAVAIMKRVAGLVESGRTPKDAVAKVLPKYDRLIQGCVATGKDEFSEQVEFLLDLQKDLLRRHQGDKILSSVSYVLVDDDLVESEGVDLWWNDPRSSASDELQAVRQATKPLVDYLAASDEEDSE